MLIAKVNESLLYRKLPIFTYFNLKTSSLTVIISVVVSKVEWMILLSNNYYIYIFTTSRILLKQRLISCLCPGKKP